MGFQPMRQSFILADLWVIFMGFL